MPLQLPAIQLEKCRLLNLLKFWGFFPKQKKFESVMECATVILDVARNYILKSEAKGKNVVLLVEQ